MPYTLTKKQMKKEFGPGREFGKNIDRRRKKQKIKYRGRTIVLAFDESKFVSWSLEGCNFPCGSETSTKKAVSAGMEAIDEALS